MENDKRFQSFDLKKMNKSGFHIKLTPPLASNLPSPPKEWLQGNANDFCKNCENIYYAKDDNGVIRQITYRCNCDDYAL